MRHKILTCIIFMIGLSISVNTEAQEKHLLTHEQAIFANSRGLAEMMYTLYSSKASTLSQYIELYTNLGSIQIPNRPTAVEIIKEKKGIYQVKVLSGALKSNTLYIHSGFVYEVEGTKEDIYAIGSMSDDDYAQYKQSLIEADRIAKEEQEKLAKRQSLLATNKLIPTTKPNADIYDLQDDNLKGNVKKMVEKAEKWTITKEYDILGRLFYYDREGYNINKGNLEYTVLPLAFPMDNVYFFNRFARHLNYLNPLYILGYNVSTDNKYFNPPYTFSYNEDGLIDKIYSGDSLTYTCEYDETGRFIKRYEDNLPTLSIRYEEKSPYDFPAYIIKRYSTEGVPREDISYSYNNIGELVEYGSDGVKYRLDGKYGQLSSMTGYNCIFQYDYYPDSNKLKEYRVLRGAPSVETHQYYYNSKGDLSKYESFLYYKDSGQIHNKKVYVWRYKYDSYGNWTSVTKYKVTQGDIEIEEKVETITREYEYYE